MINVFFKDTKPFSQVLTLLLALAFFFILAAAVVGQVGAEASVEAKRNIQAVAQILMFLCPALLYGVLFGDGVGKALGWKLSSRWGWSFLIVLFLPICFAPLTDWLTAWNDKLHFGETLSRLEYTLRLSSSSSKEITQQFLALEGTGNLILNLLIMALIPAVCEEMFFRGALQQALQKWIGNGMVAIAVAACIFSLMHGDIFAFVPRFFLGLVLGYVFYRTGSIWVNVLAHFVNNATIVVLFYLYQTGRIQMNPESVFSFVGWKMVLMTSIGLFLLFLFELNFSKSRGDRL